MPVINSSDCNTTPGGASVFAPPEGFEGDAEDYIKLMQDRYRNVDTGQQMFCTARLTRHGNRLVQYSGPYQEQARSIVHKIAAAM